MTWIMARYDNGGVIRGTITEQHGTSTHQTAIFSNPLTCGNALGGSKWAQDPTIRPQNRFGGVYDSYQRSWGIFLAVRAKGPCWSGWLAQIPPPLEEQI